MAVEIYKNNQNQILFGSSGNIICRPYDPGKYRLTDSPGIYFSGTSPISNITSPFSVVFYINYLDIPSVNNRRGFFRFESDSYVCALGAGYRVPSDGVGLDFNKPVETGSDSTGGTIIIRNSFEPLIIRNSLSIMCLYFSSERVAVSINGGAYSSINTSSIAFTSELYTKLTVGRGQRGLQTYETPGVSTCNGFNRVLVYNRELSLSELRYMYRNGAGSDPLSYSGVLKDNNLGLAELVDFSPSQDGSDMRVASRDRVNVINSMQLLNLPAGTPEEQLEYANQNLFKNFAQ